MEEKRYRCYIYGAGNYYNRFSCFYKIYEHLIDVEGIITSDKPDIKALDGFARIAVEEADFDSIDYVIIAVEDWKAIRQILLQYEISDEKLLRSTFFEIPGFDLELYLRLKKQNVSIIANSCLGGRVYKELGLKAMSPTINASCLEDGKYIEFLSNLDMYLKEEIREVSTSDHVSGSYDREKFIPAGIIAKIKWLFPHTDCLKSTIDKWNNDRKLVNKENIAALCILYNDQDAEAFDKLPIKKKLGFYYKDLNLSSVIYTPDWKNLDVRRKYDFNYAVYIHRYATNIEGISRIDWLRFLLGEGNYLRY